MATIKFGSDGETLVVKFGDGTTKRVKKISKGDVQNYQEIGVGKMGDLFGAIYMGTRHYPGDFLRDLCVYRRATKEHGKLVGGFVFYKEKKDDKNKCVCPKRYECSRCGCGWSDENAEVCCVCLSSRAYKSKKLCGCPVIVK